MRLRRRLRWTAWAGGIVAVAMLGCDRGPKPEAAPDRPFQGTRVIVGVVGDPAIVPSIKSQRGEWAARTGGDIEVRDAPVDVKTAGSVDVLIFPGDRIGDLADARVLAAIPDEAVEPRPAEESTGSETPPSSPDPFAYKDIVPAYRDLVTKYGPDRLALPLGGSALVIAYRKAAIDLPANQEAAEKAGIKLAPPRTWEEFDALARFFHGRDWDGDGSPDSGLALAWGPDAEGVGDASFLARAASSAFHRDQYAFLLDSETSAPRVASPPFVEALRAIVALKDAGPPEASGFDAEAARKAFRSGEAALLIDRAERAAIWGEEGGGAIGVWPLPGSKRVFDPSRKVWEDSNEPNRPTYLPGGGGWLVGVVAASPRREAALDFARHLAGPDSTNRLRSERGFPMLAVRSSQLARGMGNPRSAPGVEARTWADAVRRTLEADRVAPGLRLPDASGYLSDLGQARVAAVAGTSPEKALEDLARAWADRTKSLGDARQTWHHRRSLPGLSTSPEPPPR